MIYSQNRKEHGWLYRISVFFGLMLLLAGFIALVTPSLINAMEREAQWKQERLCRIYGVCDPKAGP